MKISFEMTLADYKAAYRLLRRRTFYSRYDYLIWVILILAFTTMKFSLFPMSGPNHRISETLAYLILIPLILVPTQVLIPYWSFRSNHSKHRISPSSTTDITSERIVDVMPGIRETSYTWPSVTGFGQDAHITMLYLKGSRFLFFPTSALSFDQRAELDKLISQRGIRRWS